MVWIKRRLRSVARARARVNRSVRWFTCLCWDAKYSSPPESKILEALASMDRNRFRTKLRKNLTQELASRPAPGPSVVECEVVKSTHSLVMTPRR